MRLFVLAALFAVACSAPAHHDGHVADSETPTGVRAPPPSNPACNICFNTTCVTVCPKPEGVFDPMAEIAVVPECDKCVIDKCDMVCFRECDRCMKQDDLCRSECSIPMPPVSRGMPHHHAVNGTAPVSPPTNGTTPFREAHRTACGRAACFNVIQGICGLLILFS